MFVAIVTDGQIANTGKLKDLFPNTSFPADGPNDEWLTENNVKVIVSYKTHDRDSQKLEVVEPYLDGDAVYDVNVVDLTADEISAATSAANARAEKAVRDERNKLLAESDWTQMADSPLTDEAKSSWATYRQALRDITSHANFPNLNSGDQIDGTGSDWPAKPE